MDRGAQGGPRFLGLCALQSQKGLMYNNMNGFALSKEIEASEVESVAS